MNLCEQHNVPKAESEYTTDVTSAVLTRLFRIAIKSMVLAYI